MPTTASGKFTMRIVILTVAKAPQGENGEEIESWPDPPSGTNEYFAAQEALSGGEQIVQGFRQSTGGMTLRIRGRSIPVSASDRVKNKVTGEVFAVVGVSRPDADTLITLERVPGQETGQ